MILLRAAGFSPRDLSPLDALRMSVDPGYEIGKCSDVPSVWNPRIHRDGEARQDDETRTATRDGDGEAPAEPGVILG
ncbi:MAG: hypothetical protein IIB61_08420 [Planctomycetes bacterium]|nr:hypothetical protein [Planctomycetota bacterium]